MKLELSDESFRAVRTLFRKAVYDFVMDPDEAGADAHEAYDYFLTLRRLAKELHLFFWAVAREEVQYQEAVLRQFKEYLTEGGWDGVE